MKKVIAFMGCARKKATYQAVQAFERNLKKLGDVDFEYVFLSECQLAFCRGCKLCFDKGEEFCPHHDDRDTLLAKIEQADGIVIATPNYAFQVSALLKNFLDRMSFIIHRPRFFGKAYCAIVTQAVYGGKAILKYLAGIGEDLGFTVSRGICLTTLEPMTESQQKKLLAGTEKASERFYKTLMRKKNTTPSFLRLMMFRVSRALLQSYEQRMKDYYYYREKGWLESDYYYPTSLGPVKKTTGYLFDLIGRGIAKNM